MPVIVTRSKRYKEAAKKATTELVTVEAAVDLVKSFAATKFDQTVELIFSLGIDAKQADQMIRGSLSLPHGVGKTKRVVAFCPDHLVASATAASSIPSMPSCKARPRSAPESSRLARWWAHQR